jgi:integrase
MALTALAAKNAKPGDRLSDGNGLRLDVDRRGNKSWVFRFTSPTMGKERVMGLGPFRDVSLAQAREAAALARGLIRSGQDPIEARRQERTTALQTGVKFEAYAERFISGREASWKSAIHGQQWRNSLRDYAHPHIGQVALADIDTAAVLQCLRPIWNLKPETAGRVRSRIEQVLSAAKAEGLRTGENPAQWKGHLDQVLGRRKRGDVAHFAALPYTAMPAFWQSLAGDTSDAATMLKFIILTVCRYSEARGIEAAEVQGDLWTIPAARMKAGRVHTVPLTAAALAQLPFRPVTDVTLANCIRRHTALPATTHGMRSTFRDWCGDCTDFPRETAEQALAHTVGSAAEQAYRRGSALEKRRALMEAWKNYCCLEF